MSITPLRRIAHGTSIRHRITGVAICCFIAVLDLVHQTTSLALAVVSIGTVAAILVGMRRYRPSKIWTWWTVVAALVLFTLGGAARAQFNTLGDLGPHRTMIPDFITAPGYVLLAIGLFGFVQARAKATQLRRGIIYDGMMAGLAMLACTWVWLIEPVARRHSMPIDVRTVLVCYPALSVFLVVITLQIVFGPGGERTTSERHLIVTMSAMAIGDTIYMLAEIHVLRIETALLDLPYLVAYLAAAACALDPSMRSFTEKAPKLRTEWSPGRLLLVAVAFTVPALLVLQSSSDPLPERVALFVIIIALTSTAILQIVQALRSVEKSEALLRIQALHDSLTGLPNRRSLLHNLAAELGRARSEARGIGLLFIDLDQFKLINDTLGHSRGDELLIEVAKRLQSNVRLGDLVTRIGGDEFVIVLSTAVDRDDALEFAHRLRDCLQEPFRVGDTEFYTTASIGLAYAPGENNHIDAEVLIRDADTAMYRAKEGGRDAIAVFDDSMRTQLAERVQLGRDLRHAVSRNQLHLVYQPIVRMPHGEVTGVEALVRWAHPSFGVLSPLRFIPIAEESTLIITIGNWVLEEAIKEIAFLRSMPDLGDLTVAVNVSAMQLSDHEFVPRIARLLHIHGLPGSALSIEITESEMMQDPENAISSLALLRRLGIRLAVDDFGTEYSSLAYLHRLPIDILKIDQSFVRDVGNDDSSAASLISAIIAMANALGIETIAEGVEELPQATALLALGCNLAQGFYYSRPTGANQLLDVIGLLDAAHHVEVQSIAG